MYVSEICAEGIFVTFLWWLKNMKSRSKIAPFSNERHFEIWFPKKKFTFFWSKLSKLHKKDPILHVTTTFSLKQGETRTNSVPIPHPLMHHYVPLTTWFTLLLLSPVLNFKLLISLYYCYLDHCLIVMTAAISCLEFYLIRLTALTVMSCLDIGFIELTVVFSCLERN